MCTRQHRQRDIETERPRDRETERPRDRETERPRDREAERNNKQSARPVVAAGVVDPAAPTRGVGLC